MCKERNDKPQTSIKSDVSELVNLFPMVATSTGKKPTNKSNNVKTNFNSIVKSFLCSFVC